MKKVIYVILGLVVIYLILAMVGPKEVKVERAIVVNKPAETVKSLLGDMKFFHEKWSPWTEKDPAMTVNFIGNPGEPGHAMNWLSKVDEVGQGTLAIVGVSQDSIISKLSFEGMGDSKAYYVIQPKENGTEVTWGMLMSAPFIMRPMMLFMNMDKMIGPDYEKGLANFKKAAESMSDVATYEVKEIEWPETNFIGSKREVVGVADMQSFFGKNFGMIFQELGKAKVEPQMAPTALYWTFDEKEMKGDLAAVFKVAPGVKIKGLENYTFPASKVLHVAYYGAYEKIMGAHMAIGQYMQEKGLKQNVVFEEYNTDPSTEKDTAKWLTNVYYMLK